MEKVQDTIKKRTNFKHCGCKLEDQKKTVSPVKHEPSGKQGGGGKISKGKRGSSFAICHQKRRRVTKPAQSEVDCKKQNGQG